MKLQWKSVSPEQERRNSLLHGYRSLIGGSAAGGALVPGSRDAVLWGRWGAGVAGAEGGAARRGRRARPLGLKSSLCHLLTVRPWPVILPRASGPRRQMVSKRQSEEGGARRLGRAPPRCSGGSGTSPRLPGVCWQGGGVLGPAVMGTHTAPCPRPRRERREPHRQEQQVLRRALEPGAEPAERHPAHLLHVPLRPRCGAGRAGLGAAREGLGQALTLCPRRLRPGHE